MGDAAVAAGSTGASDGRAGRLFATPQITHERRADGSVILRSARALGPVPRCLGVLLERWAVAAPDRVFLAERGAAGGMAASHLRSGVAGRQRDWPGRARPRAGARPAAYDPGRERHRSWLAMLGAMHVGVPVVPVSTAYARLSQDFGKLRYIFELVRARSCLRRRCRALRQGAGGDRRHRPRDRGQPRQPWRHEGDALRRPDRAAADARSRCCIRARGAGHGRQDPVHLGLDRPAQGRHQHAAHAVRQPGEHGRGLVVPQRPSAGDRRLAALEPHLRRQPQLQHDAAQRRQPLHRRGQAGAGPHRPHGGESAGDLPHRIFQRAARLCGAARFSGEGRGRCGRSSSPASICCSMRPPPCRRACGTGWRASASRRGGARCRSSPPGASRRRRRR